MSDNTQQQREAVTDVQKSVSESAELFDLLGNARRIHVLTGMHRRDSDVFTVGSVVDWVAGEEFGEGVSAEQRKSAYIALYQCHLPRLAAGDLISYDQDSALVRPGPRFDEAVVVLERVLPADCCV